MTSIADTRIPPGRRLALLVLCAATLMTILDETVVNVALPTIQRELGFSTAALSWVVNAYLVAYGSLLLLFGRLGDLFGRRRLLIAGLWLFTGASLLCGVATSPEWLVAARFLQGVGAALAAAVALGMVVALFDVPEQRARAMGIYASIGAVGAASGLFLGGVITDLAGWRWAFLINVPIGLLTLVAARRVLADDRVPADGTARRADALGAALLVSGLMLAIVGIVDEHALAGVVGLALLAAFGVRQATAVTPLIPTEVLRSRVVTGAGFVFALVVAAMFGFQFLLTLYLQRVLGYSPLQAGLGVLPIAAGIGVIALFAFPVLNARTGPRPLLLSGMAAFVAGMVLLAGAPAAGAAYLEHIAPSVVLLAVGGGLTLPAVMTVAMAQVPGPLAGSASGLLTTFQQVGGAIGLAALAALATSRTAGRTPAGADPTPQALVDGFTLGWTVSAGLLTGALVLAALLLRPAATAPVAGAAPQEAGVPGPQRAEQARGEAPAACPAN